MRQAVDHCYECGVSGELRFDQPTWEFQCEQLGMVTTWLDYRWVAVSSPKGIWDGTGNDGTTKAWVVLLT